MEIKKYIPIAQLCELYKIETSFFNELNEVGLLEVTTIEKEWYVHQDHLYRTEKIIRIYQELNINMEGIDVVFNLLQKVDELQEELNRLQNKLNFLEK